MNALNETEKWMIVENLVDSYYSLEDVGHQDTATQIAALLDKISPNWRYADSCRDVETHEITVSERKTGDSSGSS